MKRAATHLFKRHAKIAVFFQNYRNFTLISELPGVDPRARQRGENPTMGQLECANPRGWSGLELTDALYCHVIKLSEHPFHQIQGSQ